MPYIHKERRKYYDDEIESLVNSLNEHFKYFDKEYDNDLDADMTYVIYSLIKKMFGRETLKWKVKIKPLEILEAVKLEYYRKVIAPHEDKKENEHGGIE